LILSMAEFNTSTMWDINLMKSESSQCNQIRTPDKFAAYWFD
jgi:hypothetical protein